MEAATRGKYLAWRVDHFFWRGLAPTRFNIDAINEDAALCSASVIYYRK